MTVYVVTQASRNRMHTAVFATEAAAHQYIVDHDLGENGNVTVGPFEVRQ